MKTVIVQILALTFPFIAGCAAVDAYHAMQEESERREDEARMAAAERSCERYGFKPATDAFAACIQSEVNNIKNREAIESAARRSESGLPKTTSCTKTVMGMDCTTR